MSHRLRRLAVRVLPDRAVSAVRARRAPARSPRKAPAPRKRSAATLLSRIAEGTRLDDAVVADVRALVRSGDLATVVAAGESLRWHDASRDLGLLALALAADTHGCRELAWQHLRDVPRDVWARHAVREWVLAGLSTDRDAVVSGLRDLADDPAAVVPAPQWGDATGFAFGLHESDLARDLFARFDDVVEADPAAVDKRTVETRDWLARWVPLDPVSPSADVADEDHRVRFAVVDYDHPGRNRASGNIGDHVQSIAALGHLARHTGARFSGPDELVGLVERLAGRVPESLRLDGASGDVEIFTMHRDASTYAAIPPRTWTLCFGWFMHPVYEISFGLPLHRNLLPLFVSFHCNNRELLTPKVVEHLREHGPVGCRDWTTVDILLSMDVPAFFSGCLTTTVSTVFPPLTRPPGPDAPVGYIDVPADQVPAGAPTYRHSDDAIRFRSFTRNVDDALGLLETYRTTHSSVVTSRLHAYLPCRSLGLDVDFRPKNPSDVRFAGLAPLSDDGFDAIRSGLLDLLAPVLAAIVDGGETDEVYALWRELTADRVRAAQERRARPPQVAVPDWDRQGLADAVAATTQVEATEPRDGRPVHVVVHVADQAEGPAQALVASALASTSRPLDVTLLSRSPDAVDLGAWSGRFPAASFRLVPTQHVGDGLRTPVGDRPSARDLDVLLLPELLPDTDRVAVLPSDAALAGDVGELFDLDLDGHLFAAPDGSGVRASSGFWHVHVAANHLRAETAAAEELRRIAHQRHAFDFPGCSSAVLVLDLAAMRTAGFVDEQVALVSAFGLDLTTALGLHAGPDRRVVPKAWATVPTRDPWDGARLVHWADDPKPWDDRCAPLSEVWQASQQA